MEFSGLARRFSSETRGYYLEVIAAHPDAALSVRVALLKDLLATVATVRVPVLTCPISPIGIDLASRVGFVPLGDKSPIYIKLAVPSVATSQDAGLVNFRI